MFNNIWKIASRIANIEEAQPPSIIIGGDFTTVNSISARHLAGVDDFGAVNSLFYINNAAPGFNLYISAMSIQSDTKIVVCGGFTSYNGTISTNRIARLNSDGTLDNSFSIGTGFNNTVNALAIQDDGKILVGGSFTSYNGTSKGRLIRLNNDGTMDSSFVVVGTGLSNTISSLAIQDDGKILAGGSFTSYNGISRNRIARLNSDGTLDNSFSIGTGFNNTVNAFAIQDDGKILVGGSFTSYNGNSRNRIAKLNSNGSIDNTFDIGTGFNNTVFNIKIQNDNKILIGGNFLTYNSVSRSGTARINQDGTIDTSFVCNTGGTLNNVNTIGVI